MSLLQRLRSKRGGWVETKRQLFALSLIVAITVGTVAVAGGVLVYLESRMMEKAGNSLAALATSLTEKLDLLLFERYGDVQMMALMLGATARDAQAQTQYLNQVKEVYLYYRWLAVTDAQGKIVAATDPASVGQDRSEAIWFQTARDSRQVHLLDVQASPEVEGIPAVGFSAPISGAKGEFLGVVTARVRLSELEDMLARTINSFQVLQSGRARVEWQVLTHDGTLVSDSLLREEEKNLQALGVTSALLVRRTAEPGFVVEEHVRRHVPIVTGYARTEGYAEFPGFQWSVLVRMDREDVLAPIWNVLRVVAGLGVLIFLPLIGLLLWSVNRLRLDEKEIRTSREQYRAAMASLPVSVVRLGKGLTSPYTNRAFRDVRAIRSTQGRQPLTIRFANRAFSDLVRQRPEDTMGRPIGDVLPVEGLEECLQTTLAAHTGGGIVTEREFECAMPTGERRVLRLTISGIRRADDDDDDDDDDLVLAIEDITERKQAEKALRESEERFRLIVHHVNDALFFLDVAGVVLWTNHQAEVVTGRPMNDLVGRPLMAVLSSQSKALVETRLAAVRRGEPVPTFVELEVLRPDGSSVWLEVSATTVKIGEDAVGRLLVARDLTERRKIEQQFRQADKLAALGTLLGGIAHELNNPLFVVTGYTQLVGEKVKRGQYEGLGADLAAMHEAARRATAIVGRFLRVARTDGGPREPCRINDLMQQTLDLVANNCAIHQITAHTNLQAGLPLVLADASTLTQVFLNLITNATQAMVAAHGKGTLTVTTALVTDQSGAWVETRVADDGPGIAPEHHARIFEPFFTTKPVGQGTGLGLSICYQSVTELGGTLSLESVVGQGATFIVRLPVVNEAVASRASIASVDATP